MTKITIFYNQYNNIIGLEAKGHSGYAKSGRDIVCAAVSAVIQTAVLGLKNVVYTDVKETQGDGYLKFELVSTDEIILQKSDIILKTMVIGLRDIQSGYPAHIKLEETKNVNESSTIRS